MDVWITCPDCGQKVLSNRMKAPELLRAHKAVCPLRVESEGAVATTSRPRPRARRPKAPEPPTRGAEEEGAEVEVASP